MSDKASKVSIKTSKSATVQKRTANHLEDAEGSAPKKVPKLFPIFEKSQPDGEDKTTYQWIKPSLGPQKTCLHGVNLTPEFRKKVAAFDLDGCLIQSSLFKRGTKGKAKEPPTFQWWKPIIPAKLKEVHDAGYSIVIITNQALRSATLEEWKKKIPLIAAAVPEVPFRLFAATAKDSYRKPIPGMWYELERMYAEKQVRIDMQNSFFVGDAAGRPSDLAGTDRKWALNVGIPFYTPEEYFLELPPAPYTLTGFHVSSLPTDLPRVTPTSTPIVPLTPNGPEIVLFVGYPSLGKSSFYREHFEPAGYVHINQDTLRTRDKCVKAAQEAVQEGKSCVVDNTNRNAETRKHYVDLAKRLRLPIRCFMFNGSMELAWHNNLYRAFNLPPSRAAKEPKRELLPYSAFTSFRAQFEEPTLEGGYAEIKKVNWVFEGDEEERRRWSMWLQIDGK
ncbi:PNK3P-domain-containing protein [Wolfiporia cocos MD-104 SS10]|uniref:PNK3P-domain-containing protein n=1 Tax=Wolfiporia cocos (strain MD-104) TaxID=742152 RepID=A0A2H3JJ18_WOLCO|nr:PNK3P-domain-containing protein [Wolfiporia cocos MD-104 SS10]